MSFKGKILDKLTRPSPSTSPQMLRANDKSSVRGSGRGKKRENLSKAVISGPQDFRAVSHVTYDGRGFNLDGSDSMSRGERKKITKELDEMAKKKQDQLKVALDNRIISVLPVSEPAEHDDSFDSSYDPPGFDSPMTASFFEEVMEEVSHLDFAPEDKRVHDTGSTSDDTGVSSGASANGDDVGASRDDHVFSTSGRLNDTSSTRSSGIEGSRSRSRVSETESSTARLSGESDDEDDELEKRLSSVGAQGKTHDAFYESSDEETGLTYDDDDIVDL